jgi:hypothetical protein
MFFFYFSLALSLIKSLLNNIGNNNFLNSNGPGMDPWGVPAAAEPFHSLFSHGREDSGWVRCGRKVEGTEGLIVTQHPPYCDMRPMLIPRCHDVGKSLKKTHIRSGSTGVRTRDLPNAKWRARRLATVLGWNLAVHLQISF